MGSPNRISLTTKDAERLLEDIETDIEIMAESKLVCYIPKVN
jgi:hypothetical protein